jgi:hypothetical protein
MSSRGVFSGRGGRGAYYKNLYGRGSSRGTGGIHQTNPSNVSDEIRPSADDILSKGPAELGSVIGDKDQLERELHRIDGKPYGAYKDLKGTSLYTGMTNSGVWDFGTFLLSLDRIQSDPYAPPSKARVRVPQNIARFPSSLFRNKPRYSPLISIDHRNIALADYITRQVNQVINSKGYHIAKSGSWSEAKGGDFRIDSPGQQVLQVFYHERFPDR